MHPSRRAFVLQSGAALFALGPLSACRKKSAGPDMNIAGVVVGAGRFADPTGSTESYMFSAYDVDTGSFQRIPIGFHAHGFAPSTAQPARAALFEKKGPGACYVDLVDGTMLTTIAPTPGYAFYGHGTYTADGSALLVVESNLESKQGRIAIRDVVSFEVTAEFPTYGASPHDCRLIDGGRILVITNGGGPPGSLDPPCVTYVDVKSQELEEKLVVYEPRINAGHLDLLGRDYLAVVSAPREELDQDTNTGALLLRSGHEQLVPMLEPVSVTRRMLGESLSVAIHAPSKIVGVTNPKGNLLTFWDLETKRLVKSLDIESPRGITLTIDGKRFAVSYGSRARLMMISTKTLEAASTTATAVEGFSGSHLYTWRVPV